MRPRSQGMIRAPLEPDRLICCVGVSVRLRNHLSVVEGIDLSILNPEDLDRAHRDLGNGITSDVFVTTKVEVKDVREF